MKKVKITPIAALVAQIHAGVAVDAIVDNGVVYIPAVDMSQIINGSTTSVKEEKEKPAKEVKEEKPSKEEKPAPKKEEKAAPKKAAKKTEEEDDEDASDLDEKVLDILNKMDDGAYDAKSAIAKLTKLGVSEKNAKAFITKFENDSDMDPESALEMFNEKYNDSGSDSDDDDSDEEDDAPAKKGPAKKAPKEELVDPEDLSVGDKVSVFWSDPEYNDWYNGVVSKISKGVVSIKYDDDGEVYALDDTMTKIKKRK